MKYISAKEAVERILDAAETMRAGALENTALATLYAQHIVTYVLDYCHRRDFPSALVMTSASFVVQWTDDVANGGRSALKSIKQNDTEFQFAVAETASVGSTMDADLEALHPKLNLYRKVRWPTCPCCTSDAAQP